MLRSSADRHLSASPRLRRPRYCQRDRTNTYGDPPRQTIRGLQLFCRWDARESIGVSADRIVGSSSAHPLRLIGRRRIPDGGLTKSSGVASAHLHTMLAAAFALGRDAQPLAREEVFV